ncbi:hypothetical protein A3H26_00655 [candidate division WWE3 bacterium RIFCSPLOWO2_12_FULL_36_10]|uniref:DNA topoisomerase (ATP-hydrolyzing) n=1 Tax=candidate division WWE3 bacterium RIFCSPLOWO2_12_FULL_36_10 TaxID=1802630 RepID=A0A1F4VLB4_UNCKA|nr:MAG: hypothetical protein A3H26_00655 [candidate division WWE3 bacterium RIFCSPLOWO2_12_FULL_36_10]
MATIDDIQKYSADQIQVLEGLEPVRKRPGMYIGSTDIYGLQHLVTEIINNSMDEAMGSFANHIKLEFFEDESVAIYDNGRGIPYDIKKGYGVSALELAFTKLHAGGKFGAGGYKVSSGLHGVGSSVVNALSSWLRVIVKREKEYVMQEYENGGKILGKVKKIDPKKPEINLKDAKWQINLEDWNYETGTIVQFKPDSKIFETTDYKINFFINQLKEYAYLTANTKFEIIDHRVDRTLAYYFEGGIKSFLKSLNRNKKVLNENVFFVSKAVDEINVEVALQYNDSYNENVLTFANHVKNPEGGTHLTGFRTALTKTLNDYAQKSGLLKDGESLSGDDIKEGLTAIVSIKLDSATLQFEGQTKGKLGNSNVRPAVETVVKDGLEMFLEENPKDARAIIEKNVITMKARIAAKAARETVIRKTVLDGGGVLPGKLADCSEKDSTKTELFIVEGDSAGGCFFGGTSIYLADGRNLSFMEIEKEQKEGKEHYCYTIKNNGEVGIEKFINSRVTKKDAKVIKVVLDNDKEIVCTPDHLFMLKTGEYKKAMDLKDDISLMPLYKMKSDKKVPGITIDGYEMTWNPNNNDWIFTHTLSDRFNIENNNYAHTYGTHCHHIDFDKSNNNPSNLIRMSRADHFDLHRKHIEKTLHRPEIKEKSRVAKQTKKYRLKMSNRMKEPETRDILSRNAKKQWENDEYKKYMKSKFQEFYASNSEYRKLTNKRLSNSQKEYWNKIENVDRRSKKVKKYYEDNPNAKIFLSLNSKMQWKDYDKTYLNKSLGLMKQIYDQTNEVNENLYNLLRAEINDKSIIRMDTITQRFFNGNKEELKEAVMHYNHKIKRIEVLNERMDVYDAEVPNTHNFALASGVFVHNSAKQGRDREIQAILPLFGKVLNTERARLDKIVDSDKFKNLIIAIGAGIGDQYDATKLRYNKLIIMADADTDGMHIMTLYLTFFFRHMYSLIENGHVYIAVPPLYKATWGKNKKYLFNDVEREKFLKTSDGKNAIIQRFKGLGEMNAEELWETTMNPMTRVLKQVQIADASKADEVFTMLMGEEVPPRKRFIQTHAKQANVDIM